jgi:hypothetical protein
VCVCFLFNAWSGVPIPEPINAPVERQKLEFPLIEFPKTPHSSLLVITMSLAKQNFSTSSEEAINQQINTELQASQVYLSMASWAQHTTVALPGKSASACPKIRFNRLTLHVIVQVLKSISANPLRR